MFVSVDNEAVACSHFLVSKIYWPYYMLVLLFFPNIFIIFHFLALFVFKRFINCFVGQNMDKHKGSISVVVVFFCLINHLLFKRTQWQNIREILIAITDFVWKFWFVLHMLMIIIIKSFTVLTSSELLDITVSFGKMCGNFLAKLFYVI